MYRLLRLAFSGFLICMICACSRENREFQRGVYYWKNTEGSLSEEEVGMVNAINPSKIYVRFFDVALDDLYEVAPVAKTTLRNDGGLKEYKNGVLVPVVYIENKVFKEIKNDGKLAKLAENVSFLVQKYVRERFDRIPLSYEVQIDCDWTPSTKKAYFSFLKLLKKKSGKTISCTLRLYPFKYSGKMGVPPVDKVSLMCYNLLSPLDHPKRNSILDLDELEAYLDGAKEYPIHTDIILPAYSWIQIYHNKQFSAVANSGIDQFKDEVKKIDELWYEAKADFYIGEIFVKEGDRLKVESVSEADAQKALQLLNEYLEPDEKTVVSIYHIDDSQITQLTDEKIRNYYSIR